MYNNSIYQPTYAQQGGGGGGGALGGQWGNSDSPTNNQPFPPSSGQYATNGYSQGPLGQDSPSSATLFQQQLAYQQRTSQNNPPPQTGNRAPPSSQPFLNGQQHFAQARPNQNQPAFPTSSQSPAPSSSQLPQSQGSPYAPQQQQQQQQQRPMTGPEIANILRGVSMQGMNPQIFSTLTPIQQHAVREFIARSRMHQAQQQVQLGLGLPGAQATPPAALPRKSSTSNQPLVNGSPAPATRQAYQAPAPSHQPPQSSQQQQQPPTATQISFLRLLGDFCTKRGIPFATPPVVEGRSLELPKLYAAVHGTGGFVNTSARRLWGNVATALGFPATPAEGHPEERLQRIASAYHSVLWPFEQHVSQMQQERIQAARAAGQTPSTSAAGGAASTNSVPATAATAPPQPQPPFSQPSPFATLQSNPPPHSAPTPTSLATANSPRLNSASVTASTSMPTSGSTRKSVDYSSKVAPPIDARPSTASSRRESVSIGDVKGKGRASGDTTRAPSVKIEDFASKGSSTPKNAASVLPDTAMTASPRPVTANVSSKVTAPPMPEPPTQPPRRKRQKIEYVPLNRSQEAVAGYELGAIDEILQATARRKRPRTAYDLGLVDLHSLTMSLRSRLASEVSFALNSLTLISMSIRTHPQETNAISFPLARCRDLYDELVDLAEETAFGFEDERPDVETPAMTSDHDSPPETYPDLFQIITEQAGQLLPPDPDERNRIARLADSGHTPLQPIDILLSVTNILRNFSIAEENSSLMGEDEHLVDVLARLAHLPLKPRLGPEDTRHQARWPIQVDPLDSMTLKKDVLELLVNFGLLVRLEAQETRTAQALFDLLTFFLLDAHRHAHTYFDLSQTPGSASRLAQPASIRIAHYVDLGLAAFAEISLLDSNRTILSRIAPIDVLQRLFDSMIRLVPMSEADFQILTHESGLVYVHNLVMSLYNLVFLSPPELKLALRRNPAYVKSLMRVVRRLSGTGSSDSAAAAFQPLIERCIAILHLLSTLEGVTVGSSGMEASEVPWWGMSMSGWEEDDDVNDGGDDEGPPGKRGRAPPRPYQPQVGDSGTVKARVPPTASVAAGLEPGLPILSGETKSLFESLDNKSMVNVFASLVTLL